MPEGEASIVGASPVPVGDGRAGVSSYRRLRWKLMPIRQHHSVTARDEMALTDRARRGMVAGNTVEISPKQRIPSPFPRSNCAGHALDRPRWFPTLDEFNGIFPIHGTPLMGHITPMGTVTIMPTCNEECPCGQTKVYVWRYDIVRRGKEGNILEDVHPDYHVVGQENEETTVTSKNGKGPIEYIPPTGIGRPMDWQPPEVKDTGPAFELRRENMSLTCYCATKK